MRCSGAMGDSGHLRTKAAESRSWRPVSGRPQSMAFVSAFAPIKSISFVATQLGLSGSQPRIDYGILRLLKAKSGCPCLNLPSEEQETPAQHGTRACYTATQAHIPVWIPGPNMETSRE